MATVNPLLELAGVLQAGRPEPTLTGRAGRPYAHGDVAAKMLEFTEFANDQYRDGVAMLAALSMRLDGSDGFVDGFIDATTYHPAP